MGEPVPPVSADISNTPEKPPVSADTPVRQLDGQKPPAEPKAPKVPDAPAPEMHVEKLTATFGPDAGAKLNETIADLSSRQGDPKAARMLKAAHKIRETMRAKAVTPSPLPPDLKQVPKNPHPEKGNKPVVPPHHRYVNGGRPRPPRDKYQLVMPMDEAWPAVRRELKNQLKSMSLPGTHPEDIQEIEDEIADTARIYQSGDEDGFVRKLAELLPSSLFKRLVQSTPDVPPSTSPAKAEPEPKYGRRFEGDTQPLVDELNDALTGDVPDGFAGVGKYKDRDLKQALDDIRQQMMLHGTIDSLRGDKDAVATLEMAFPSLKGFGQRLDETMKRQVDTDGSLAASAEPGDSGFDSAEVAGTEDLDDPAVIEHARKLWTEKGVESPYFKRWFGESKAVDESGKPLTLFHGARRSDRIAGVNKFDPKRATSGPMAFFTSDSDIASKYATGKADTSLEVPDSYAAWFKVKTPGSRKPVDIDRAWWGLPIEQRQKIAALAPRISRDDDGNIIMEDESHKSGIGNYDYEIREKKGNALAALMEGWLNGGTLYGEEEKFLDVLKMAGVDGAEFHDPHAEHPGVIPVHLSIKNPLNTSAIPDDVMASLMEAAKRKRGKQGSGADQWDKRYISGPQWVERLEEDRKNGTTHAWTSIPDWATDALRAKGYDGIQDVGGKYGGDKHAVWIPFSPTQIKSATGNRGTFDDSDPRIDASAEPGLGFQNNILSALDSWQPKGTPQQLLAHLQKAGGATAQADIVGLKEFLAGKASVTRDEVRAFVEDKSPTLEEVGENARKNEWVVIDDNDNTEEFTSQQEADDYVERRVNSQIDNEYANKEYPDDETLEFLRSEYRTGYRVRPAQLSSDYSDYQLGGPSENYDEVHVTVPNAPRALPQPIDPSKFRAEMHTVGRDGMRHFAIYDQNGRHQGAVWHQGEDPEDAVRTWAAEQHQEAVEEAKKSPVWQDGHGGYNHVKNPVVRLRHNDRVDADGKKVFFIEEMQGPQDQEQPNMSEEFRDRIYDIGLKRALRKAVEGGYDKLAWTTGKQQVDRYPGVEKKLNIIGYSGTNLKAYDHDGNEVISRAGVSKDDLPSLIGQEATEKLLSVPPKGTLRMLEDQDITIGGEGLKNLYDSMLRSKADKLLKRAGGKVTQTDINAGTKYVNAKVVESSPGRWDVVQTDTGDVLSSHAYEREARAAARSPQVEDWQTVHAIEITPRIRDMVMKGLPLYRTEGKDVTAMPPGLEGQTTPAPRSPAEVQLEGQIHGKAKAAIDAAPIDPKFKEAYAKNVQTVLRTMPAQALQAVASHDAEFTFHESPQAIMQTLADPQVFGAKVAEAAKQISDSGRIIGGAVVTRAGGKRTVALDGGKELHGTPQGQTRLTQEGVEYYAHELTHLIDFGRKGGRHSDTADWRAVWQEELAGSKLTQYAGTSAMEGFAEFGRLLYSGKYDLGKVKQQYPQAYAYFAGNGFVPDVAATDGGVESPEVFAGKVTLNRQGEHADIAMVPSADRSPLSGAVGRSKPPAVDAHGRPLPSPFGTEGDTNFDEDDWELSSDWREDKGGTQGPNMQPGKAREHEEGGNDSLAAAGEDAPGDDAALAGVENLNDPRVIEDARRKWKEMGTESPYFKRWFGESAVREDVVSSKQNFADMPPKVVYHGTNKDIAEFKSGLPTFNNYGFLGNVETERHGIFFAANPDFAATFANAKGGQQNTIPAYLKIETPFLMDDQSLSDWYGQAAQQYDNARQTGQGIKEAEKEFKLAKYLYNASNKWEAFDGIDGKYFVEFLQSKGYDGAFLNEEGHGLGEDAPMQDVWIAFSPTQIKSATGNRGTFDGDNPRIDASVETGTQ